MTAEKENSVRTPRVSPQSDKQRLIDFFAEIEACLCSIQGALRHYQQPQDFHFHRALDACRKGIDLVTRPKRHTSMTPESLARARGCACTKCRAQVESFLSTIRASGFAVVPREPTEAMIKAAFNPGLSGDTPSPDDAWRDMVAAGELT